MLTPRKKVNYPLVIIHASLFVDSKWYRKKKLSSPWLKWFTWELSEVADIFILGDSKVGEEFIDKNGVFYTEYIPEIEIEEMGGPKMFVQWLHYGAHPVYVILPNEEKYKGVLDATYFTDFNSIQIELFGMVGKFRKL